MKKAPKLRKTWVLDTETKGTGAEMVPLDRLEKQSASKPFRPVTAPKPRPRPEPAAAPREPWKFKVVDVMTQLVLAEGADTRATLEVLRGIRSIVDVRIYVWDAEAGDWQPLGFEEKKRLTDYAKSGLVRPASGEVRPSS
jgi:hypothetical protein